MQGHISKEGITKDLEAMKRVGIGGAYIGVISGQSGAAITQIGDTSGLAMRRTLDTRCR